MDEWWESRGARRRRAGAEREPLRDGGEDLRDAKVRQPAAEMDSGVRQFLARSPGIPHPVDGGRELQFPRRLDQKFAQLRGPLFVAPVTDPTRSRSRLISG